MEATNKQLSKLHFKIKRLRLTPHRSVVAILEKKKVKKTQNINYFSGEKGKANKPP